jgi:hypothetical protein
MIDLNYRSASNKTAVVSECIIVANSSNEDSSFSFQDKPDRYISVERRFLDSIGVMPT